MNFNSMQFLVFLPIVLALYWIIPHKARWALLLIASYYFYMSWNVWLVFLILSTTAVSYGSAIAISRTKNIKLKKFWLAFTVVICLGVLVFFKYFNFICANVINLLNAFTLNIDDFALNLILPVGISFYTFQTLSYVIEVYKGNYKAETHFGYYALYVSYFPQLVAGPIEQPSNLIPQLKEKHFLNADDMACGLRILICGFFLKCAVADVCGIYVNNVFGNAASATTLSVMIAGALFTVQMFGDFAGYSLIATGAARMMGVKLSRNFNRPYLATSYGDFFRRWHITLTNWFTNYVYIPLGGNRKGKARRILNIFIVFFLCGLWHGANWTYVLWGVYAAFFLSAESLLKQPVKDFLSSRNVNPYAQWITFIRIFVMWLIFIPAAILFRSDSIASAGEMFAKLFTGWGVGEQYFVNSFNNLGIDGATVLLLALLISAMCLMHNFERYENIQRPPLLSATASRSVYAQRICVYFFAVFAIAVFWLSLLQSSDSSVFLYFQF